MNCLSWKKIVGILFLLPFHVMAQDITGLWKGVLYNDSTRENLRYEVGINEDHGKFIGFSHIFFIEGDREFFGLKRIKLRKVKDKYILEDVEIVADNYPVPPPKGVRLLGALNFTELDGVMYLDGLFTTTRTKAYAPATGMIHLTRKKDFQQSALVPHLAELGLDQELSFLRVETTVGSKEGEFTPRTKTAMSDAEKIQLKQKQVIVKKAAIKNNTVSIRPVNIIAEPAAEVNLRTTQTVETVFYKSDSLQLTLYDNGEVDGDTVSVLMNGKLIMPNQGLSTHAIKKTIYITKDTPDSIELVMYAENLGTIPPNTGLLVVHDGEDIYEIRFSSDLSKNAAIIFRRKK